MSITCCPRVTLGSKVINIGKSDSNQELGDGKAERGCVCLTR